MPPPSPNPLYLALAPSLFSLHLYSPETRPDQTRRFSSVSNLPSDSDHTDMATVCISNCAEETGSYPLRRARYVNLYKWAESDANGTEGQIQQQLYLLHPPRVVDSVSVSCRQLYLRSGYTFSRKESVPERTKKCFGRVKERVALRKFQSRPAVVGRRRRRRRSIPRRTRFAVVKRVKDFSCEALRSIFQRLLSCTTSVDVVERN